MTRRAANTRSERRGKGSHAKGSIESYTISAKHYDAAYAVKQDLVDLPFYLALAKRYGGTFGTNDNTGAERRFWIK